MEQHQGGRLVPEPLSIGTRDAYTDLKEWRPNGSRLEPTRRVAEGPGSGAARPRLPRPMGGKKALSGLNWPLEKDLG